MTICVNIHSITYDCIRKGKWICIKKKTERRTGNITRGKTGKYL
jgi:uncharacterized protein YwbE